MKALEQDIAHSGVLSGPAPSQREDAALLAGLSAGNDADFEALFRRYYGPIHNLLERLVGDEADDLAQEVFWRLYTRPPRQGNLKVWLYRVATRLGYNALRARRRENCRQTRAAQETRALSDALGDPAETVERRAESALVRAVLARLKRREATILALRYSGLRYAEIAQAMGIASGSVGTLLIRAERAFAALYTEAEKGEGGKR